MAAFDVTSAFNILRRETDPRWRSVRIRSCHHLARCHHLADQVVTRKILANQLCHHCHHLLPSPLYIIRMSLPLSVSLMRTEEKSGDSGDSHQCACSHIGFEGDPGRGPGHAGRFSFGRESRNATCCGDQSRRPTSGCEPSPCSFIPPRPELANPRGRSTMTRSPPSSPSISARPPAGLCAPATG